jgi:hypothetical protein
VKILNGISYMNEGDHRNSARGNKETPKFSPDQASFIEHNWACIRAGRQTLDQKFIFPTAVELRLNYDIQESPAIEPRLSDYALSLRKRGQSTAPNSLKHVGEKLASPSPYLLFISTIGDNCEKEQGTMW